MYKAIKQLLLKLISDYYSTDNIFQGFLNNWTLPKHNNFIVISKIDSGSVGQPQHYYDKTNEITTYNNLDYTQFQIDFYGVNANLAAKKIRLAIQSRYATNFFYDGYGYSVYKTEEVKNLTNLLDQGEYVDRYIIKFSLFDNNYLSTAQLSAESAGINLFYAGNTTGSIIEE